MVVKVRKLTIRSSSDWRRPNIRSARTVSALRCQADSLGVSSQGQDTHGAPLKMRATLDASERFIRFGPAAHSL